MMHAKIHQQYTRYCYNYCTSTNNSNGLLCGWNFGTKCVDRTCDKLLSTNTNTDITCANYLQKNILTLSNDIYKLAGNFCCLPNKPSCDYAFLQESTLIHSNQLNVRNTLMVKENFVHLKLLMVLALSKALLKRQLSKQKHVQIIPHYLMPIKNRL
ncbi:unnamed protein product [Paramecium sonneborni]|uniref:Uncharacterized protein n=1 Tax=Paramecium sonneborni TaxID=65129 RepID=A0A8S1RHT3_9CILI|nr:unnamed protein product [Paramecium sonneborni]